MLDQLQPLTGTHAVVAGLAYRGSVSYWQGLALHSLGRLDDAETRLRTGVLQHRLVDSPPWIAQAELALAAVLLERSHERDAEAARDLLRRASTAADRMGMSLLRRRCGTLCA